MVVRELNIARYLAIDRVAAYILVALMSPCGGLDNSAVGVGGSGPDITSDKFRGVVYGVPTKASLALPEKVLLSITQLQR